MERGLWLTLVVYPEKERVASKTKKHDLSLPLDLERHRLMVPVVARLVAQRRGELLLWPMEHESLTIEFACAVSRLGLRGLGFSLYAVRHGGASHNRSAKSRDSTEVQQRGRWRSFANGRPKEKHGRLGLEAAKLTPSHRSQGALAPRFVKELLERKFEQRSDAQAAAAASSRSSRVLRGSPKLSGPAARPLLQ